MSVRHIGLAGLVALVLAPLACASTGADPNEPGPLPHGGTGAFRPLSRAETGVSGSPPGRAVALGAYGFDSGSVADGHLFYAAALLPEDAPPADPDALTSEVDWSAFEPRAIYRSAPKTLAGYEDGALLLGADQPWEGEEVFEPWALSLADGRVLLFYAAEGGIGLAEAPAADGAFSKIGTGPVVAADATSWPRRPSVVENEDGTLTMFFERDGALHAADSGDGRTFTVRGPIALGPAPEDAESAEVAVGDPGAVRVVSAVGRSIVRLYFVSHRDDGTSQVHLAATTDGVTFERFERPVVDDVDRFAPAPVIVDSRVTLLYLTATREADGRQMRTLIATIAPRTVTFGE